MKQRTSWKGPGVIFPFANQRAPLPDDGVQMAKKKKTVDVHIWLNLVLLIIVGSLGFLSWWSWASKPYSPTGNSERITITPGKTAAQLAEELKERHLIRSAWVFRYLARFQPTEFKIYVGDYLLTPAMAPAEMIKRLLHGSGALVNNRVTIPEGYTTEQIIDLLVQNGIASQAEFTKVISEDGFAYPFLKDVPKGINRLEGYLFPNTYDIPVKTDPHAVIDLFLQQFAKELTPEVEKQLQTLNLTVPQWVTLGSLVEKEAKKTTDRPLIASVFMNRLKVGQPLQSCATVQFLLSTSKEKLYAEDLQILSPYNTYLHIGLPPGPIANPGHASLQAALRPAQTDFFYFVVKNDAYHAFSKTYEEHLANVALYQ